MFYTDPVSQWIFKKAMKRIQTHDGQTIETIETDLVLPHRTTNRVDGWHGDHCIPRLALLAVAQRIYTGSLYKQAIRMYP